MGRLDGRMFWWALVAVVAYGALASALEQADEKGPNDTAVTAVDALLDCTFFAEEGETCDREQRNVLASSEER